MKKLEELGISPAPWKIRGEDFDVVDANNEIVSEYQFVKPDVRLIAAAPDMYEALRMYHEAFEEIRKSAWFIDANFYEIMQLNKIMKAAEVALAKAAGEGEVEK